MYDVRLYGARHLLVNVFSFPVKKSDHLEYIESGIRSFALYPPVFFLKENKRKSLTHPIPLIHGLSRRATRPYRKVLELNQLAIADGFRLAT